MIWYGFEKIDFTFEGYEATVVLPEKKADNATLILKTEYWDAFPETEIELLKRGHFLGYIKNKNRWGTDDDIDRKSRFVKHITKEYMLPEKCVLVGMSCGGLSAIKFSAKHPEDVACIYIDAPVLNYMSCPCGFGVGERTDDESFTEILTALDMSSISELICYRDTPQDNIPLLIKNKIPVILVSGDSDTIVPYVENGILIEKAYKQNDLPIDIFIKPGCNHHPHGLDNPTPIVKCILKYV